MDHRGHVAAVVAQVVATEVARTGARGVIVAAPPGDARALVVAWLEPLVEVTLPAEDEIAALARALEGTGAAEETRSAAAVRAWAESAGAVRGLLPVGVIDKTTLLLGTEPLPARVLPLGDLGASALADMGCMVPLPPVLRGRSAESVRAVDAALAAYLERGLTPASAFGALGTLGDEVRGALDAAEVRRRGLLVPKLAAWTVGADLDR